ncbi:MAG: glycolate oxidase subunit GlcF [Burkholderiales bacterium]|nr:glycolate oxidase subunit GlcF [Burkholderiales bacterium]
MQTKIAPEWQSDPEVQEAEQILRQCVHCGLCNATCPTYQLLGDERDGPRGRIYLIKQMLEGETVTQKTQTHLDRCLTCRACETTCPSGVKYARLLDIGRKLAEQKIARPWLQSWWRQLLKQSVSRPQLLGNLLKVAKLARPLLSKSAQEKITQHQNSSATPKSERPISQHAKKVLLLEGCAQSQLAPNIQAATMRVLDRLQTQCVVAPQAGCCGAVHQHMGDDAGAKQAARRNIDAWWPMLDPDGDRTQTVAAIVMNSSGCGLAVKEYAQLLVHDEAYAEKAKRVSAMTCDLIDWVHAHRAECIAFLGGVITQSVVWHAPCTLQHGLKIRGEMEDLLASLGVEVRPCRDSHLCCGSAGLYSILQPSIAAQLRDQKVQALEEHHPDLILSANMACQQHMQVKSATPILHWIEFFDQVMRELPAGAAESEQDEDMIAEVVREVTTESLKSVKIDAAIIDNIEPKPEKKSRPRTKKKVTAALVPDVLAGTESEAVAESVDYTKQKKSTRKPRVAKPVVEADAAPIAKPKTTRKRQSLEVK